MKNRLIRAILCTVLCAAMILTLPACFLFRPLDNDPDSVYGKLLSEYAVLLKACADGTDLSTVESPTEKGLSDELFDSLKAIVPETECLSISDMGYAFYDLDGDGTYECFLMKNDGSLYALYACKNGQPYPVEIYRGGSFRGGVLLEDGTVFTGRIIKEEDKLKSSEYHYSRFQNGEMVPERSYVIDYLSDTAYAVEYGEKRNFSPEENQDLNYAVSAIFDVGNQKIYAKRAGLWFRSIDTLTDGEAESDAATPDTADKPAFDISSYDAILTTLTAMKPLMQSFVYKEWVNGDLDDDMVISSPEDYRAYINLLLSCASNDGYFDTEEEYHPLSIGYAYRDMNADGSDELFILNEDSDLIALFTLKNGSPVLLWSSGDSLFNTKMNEQGHLQVSRYPHFSFNTNDYVSYELTPEGELSPVAYLYVSQHIRKMLKDGKVVVVDPETFSAEFQRVFEKKQGQFWTNEWNEGGKLLKFTALP